MSVGTSAFEFPFRDEDFVEKLLRDYPALEPYRSVLVEYASTSTARDEDLESFLGQQAFAPALGVANIGGQTVAALSLDALEFDIVDFQSSDVFSWDLADPTKVTIGQRGVVMVTANADFDTDATGSLRSGNVRLNGTTTVTPLVGQNPLVFDGSALGAITFSFESGDYIELMVAHNGGGPLAVTGSLQVAFLGTVDG